MPELDEVIKTLLEEQIFCLTFEEHKIGLQFDKEIYDFVCKIQEIVEDSTEGKPLTNTMLAYLIVGLTSKLADINNPNDSLKGDS